MIAAAFFFFFLYGCGLTCATKEAVERLKEFDAAAYTQFHNGSDHRVRAAAQ